MRDPYEVLGISYSDSFEDARAKYRALCKKFHPDLAGYQSTEKFKEIQTAWESIKDKIGKETGRSMWYHKTLFSIYKKGD